MWALEDNSNGLYTNGWADAGVGIGTGWVDGIPLVELKSVHLHVVFLTDVDPILDIFRKWRTDFKDFSGRISPPPPTQKKRAIQIFPNTIFSKTTCNLSYNLKIIRYIQIRK